jgi:hypothetical protein
MVMWGGLASTVLMILLIGLLARLQRRQERGYTKRPTTLDCARLVSEALALDEYATARLEAAQRAATTYEQIALDVAMLEAEREAAWEAHSEAAAAHTAASEAQAGLPIEQTIPDPLQREISSAARAAYKRGEITVEELRAVWQKVDGWDQEREDRAHELSRLRAEEAEAWRRYHAATFAENTSRRAAELAEAASRALTEEAADAARRAELARIAAADCAAQVKRR